MSHKENDKYLEELQEATQDLADELKRYRNAEQEVHDAIEWRDKRKKWLDDAKAKLQMLKEKDL